MVYTTIINQNSKILRSKLSQNNLAIYNTCTVVHSVDKTLGVILETFVGRSPILCPSNPCRWRTSPSHLTRAGWRSRRGTARRTSFHWRPTEVPSRRAHTANLASWTAPAASYSLPAWTSERRWRKAAGRAPRRASKELLRPQRRQLGQVRCSVWKMFAP